MQRLPESVAKLVSLFLNLQKNRANSVAFDAKAENALCVSGYVNQPDDLKIQNEQLMEPP